MWSQESASTNDQPSEYVLRQRRLEKLRLPGWLFLSCGAVLFANELGLWWAYLGLAALILAVGSGIYLSIMSWRAVPRLRFLGAVPIAAVGLFLIGDPVTHLMAAWVLIGLGLTVLARTR